jgi:mRNA-degrading endonuclease toxin of MazEF toxin-antitoxin module
MIEPGDVVVSFLPGARESKRRPAIVISAPDYYARRPDVILVIITSRVETANTDFDCVLFDWRNAGLRSPSAMRSYIFTVEQNEVTKIGHLSDEDWREVQARLKLALAV